MQLADLDAHLDAELGVEVRQRFVEQEHLGFADHGAAHGDALALAAGELGGAAVEKGGQPERLGDAADAGEALGLGDAGDLQRIAHVVGDAHVGIERVVLEHHGAAALARLEAVHDRSVDGDVAGGDLLEACDHAEKGRLAAAGRAEHDDEFAGMDVEIERFHHGRLAVGLGDLADGDVGHEGAFTSRC